MDSSNDIIFIDQSANSTPKKIYNQKPCHINFPKAVPKISLSIPEQHSYFPTRHSVSFEIPKIRLESMSNKTSCCSDETDSAGRRFSDMSMTCNLKNVSRSIKPVHLVKQEAICESQAASKESLRLIKSVNTSPNLSGSIIEFYKKKFSLTGIDAISLDYMRANGNLRGFRQLRNARELISQNKAASFSMERSSVFPSSLFRKGNISLPSEDEKEERSNEESSLLIDETKLPKAHEPHVTVKQASPANTIKHRRPKLVRNKSMKTVGFRLGKRKTLLEQRKKISDFSVGFALFGIIVMIIELELCDNMKLYGKRSFYSYFLKSLVGISTILLIGLIIFYHFIEVKILSLDDSVEDWRITISLRRIFQLIIEIIICSIHPFPGNILLKWSIYLAGKKDISARDVSFDIVLGICMFSRLYLFYRSMLLHSRLLSDVGSRSIGAMNKVNFDISFLIKTMMTLYPVRVLLVFIISVIVISSWILHTCENAYDSFHADMFNSIWLICITFLSIGYGDVFPHTVCGRIVSIANGLMGCACTALVVAVFAKRLELTKAERHVMEFMMDNQMSKKLKFYAANVLRETWLLYKYTKLTENVNIMKVWSHQRKLLRAIYGLRKMKSKLRKLEDESNQTGYLIQSHHRSHILLAQVCQDQLQIKNNLILLEDKLIHLQNQTKELPGLIAQQILKSKEKA